MEAEGGVTSTRSTETGGGVVSDVQAASKAAVTITRRSERSRRPRPTIPPIAPSIAMLLRPCCTQDSAILAGSNCKTQARMSLIVPSGIRLRSSVAGRRAAVGVGALPLGGQEFPAVRARIQGQAQDAS